MMQTPAPIERCHYAKGRYLPLKAIDLTTIYGYPIKLLSKLLAYWSKDKDVFEIF
jgi:hypothetical protein